MCIRDSRNPQQKPHGPHPPDERHVRHRHRSHPRRTDLRRSDALVRPADAVRAVFAADYDAVQRETCGHAAGIRSGSVGVERERSADLLRGDSHVGQIEVEDIARHADPLLDVYKRQSLKLEML